eukprot:CAMPEP_0176496550 /NCGR_PEP_ID=MMETSP0200_2-20121128/11252_1 /TAXON_ID=947934 /ORGANISM="Chaetoceros sp., Strain GSL56" /LENGTH=809 /DNA_ID=CAMNT_0017894507 /DNA_START=29 /DNA_END=2458 /DNA_ORIENTATION=-
MELTLTGASLHTDGNKSENVVLVRNGCNSGDVSTLTSSTAAPNASVSHHHHHHHHSHNHNHSHGSTSHGDQQCYNNRTKREDYRPVESIPKEKLISNPDVLFSAIIASVKGGSFDTFKYLVDIVIQEERDRQAPLSWGAKVEDVGLSSDKDTAGLTGDSRNGYMCALGNRDKDGHTIAHWTAKRTDDIRFIEYLTQQVKKINIHAASTDNVGMTPLHWAATEGSIPIVNFILKHIDEHSNGLSCVSPWNNGDIRPSNHPINARDKSGCTPLLIASQYGHADLAAFLIKRGADPNAVDDSKDTALHWAAYKGAVSVCGLLLHLNGVEGHLDTVDTFGQTPLHLASLRGNTDVITYIIEQAETHDDSTNFQDGMDEGHNVKQQSRSLNLTLPAKLLNMKDKDGKTAVDLAVKKKKPHAEMLLRQYMTKYCITDQSIIQKVISIAKLFLSCRSWLSWLGLISENGRPPRFIFWFVAGNMALAFMYELVIYVPLIRGGGGGEASDSSGRLWDYINLHICTIASFIMTWLSFIMVHRTDPGMLAKRNFATSNNFSGALGVETCLDASPIQCLDENKRIRREMHTLTNDLRNMYEETLESFASEADGNDDDRVDRLPLCHSCHIARPYRSKHCRVLNRCVLLFDHHCPFVGTTIGLYNYKYFYLFVVSFTITEILFTTTGILYLKKAPDNVGVEVTKLLIALYFSIYMFMTGGLSIYHTQLVRKNLTTNEHQNFFKYKYLKDENGAYRNPYNRGCFRNFLSRFFPGKNTYALMLPNSDIGRTFSGEIGGNEADIEMGQVPNKNVSEKLSLVKNVA